MSILETTCYFVKGVLDGIREPHLSTVYLFGEDKASLPVIDKSHRNMWSPRRREEKNDIPTKKMKLWSVQFFSFCICVQWK